MKLIFVAFLLAVSSMAFSAEFTVKMSKYFRNHDGSFAVFMEPSAMVDLYPANELMLKQLNQYAETAIQTNRDVVFKVEGTILSDETVFIPRAGAEYRMVKFFVYKAN